MISGSSIAIDSFRWAKAVPLLSLDLLLPIYPDTGLTPRDPIILQRVLREQLIRARSNLEFGQSIAGASNSAVSNSLTTLDADDARHLAQWIGCVFHADPSDGAGIRAWSTLLRHCRHLPMLWNELFPDGGWGTETLHAFERSISIDAFEQRYEELNSKPLSDWDLHVYALHLFDDDDSEGAPSGPYLWIAPTVRDFQGYRFWSWMRQSLSVEGLHQLRLRAENINRRELVLPEGPLPDPNVLAVSP